MLAFWNASIMQPQAFAADRDKTMTLKPWNVSIVQSQSRSAANTASAFRGVTSGRLEMPYSVQWNQRSIIVFLCDLTTCMWQPPSWAQDQLIRQLYSMLYEDDAGYDFVWYHWYTPSVTRFGVRLPCGSHDDINPASYEPNSRRMSLSWTYFWTERNVSVGSKYSPFYMYRLTSNGGNEAVSAYLLPGETHLD